MTFLPYLAAHNSPGTVPRAARPAAAARSPFGAQHQQQAPRHGLNRRQQQQGSTEYQAPARPVATQGKERPAQPGTRDTAAGSGAHDVQHGGHGGTPVGLPKTGAANAAEVRDYVDEAGANVDA